ncbi:hypothetical protein SAMN05216347_104110 [Streptococcus equinus]|uniref:ABC-2 type transport system permease protein n=1 Tax=Streptococcus equinus TaxID=1335 RepID=A0A1H0PE91_STREI|nr:ABC transporter permease [Streptococcus equinus]SDP03015.1 hypothetical protein SAMN05216347_104110 [Streptococcus equinus]
MKGYILAEWKKTKKVQLLAIGILFWILTSFIALFTYYYYHSDLTIRTESRVLWGQLTLYNSSLLYPPLLAIYVGLLWRPEFENNTLDMLRSNQVSLSKLTIAKIISIVRIILPIQLLFVILYIVVAQKDQILLMSDVLLRLKWVILSVIGSVSIICIQTYFSAKTRNLSKSVTLAAIGGFGTFALMFYSDGINKFYPYAQPMLALRSKEMNNLSSNDFSCFELILFLLVNIGFSLLFYWLSCSELCKNKDKK